MGVPCFGGFIDQITTGKKGTVVWPLVGMFGGSMSSDCFGGFLDQITTRKKVQLFGHRLQCFGGSMNLDCFGGFVAMFFDGFLDQITNYDQKKKRYSRLAIGWKSIWKVSITATCRLEWHYQSSKKIMAFSLSNIEIQ